MIHVVDFEKTAFSTLSRGVLPPFGPQISAEGGWATQSLAPGKPGCGWPPRSTWPLFSHPTPHARPAGSGRARPPRWLLPATDRRIDKDRTGPDLDDWPLFVSMSPKQAIRADKIN